MGRLGKSPGGEMNMYVFSAAVVLVATVVKAAARFFARRYGDDLAQTNPMFVGYFFAGIVGIFLLTGPWSPVESVGSLVEPALMIGFGLLGVHCGGKVALTARRVWVVLRPILLLEARTLD